MNIKRFFKYAFIQVVIAIIFSYFWIKNKKSPKLLSIPKTVNHFELPTFMGHWYEIAHIPFYWERNCVCTQIYYKIDPYNRNMYSINNTCHQNSTNGIIKFTEGKGWLSDDTGAKHKHSFFWPIAGDIWISATAPDFSWIIFGHPTRDYLWIISRTPTMNETLYKDLVKFAEEDGYPVEKLVKSIQICGSNFQLEKEHQNERIE